MNCPNCSQPTESGAAYCGNCGQELALTPIAKAYVNQTTTHAGQTLAPLAVAGARGVPMYALATPAQHSGDTKAVLAVMFGIIGMLGVLFAALIGLGLGLAGLVMGTMSRRSSKHVASTVGIVLSVIVVLASLGSWTYLINHNKQVAQSSAPAKVSTLNSATAITADNVTTPCYTAGFTSKLNIANAVNSCDIQAYDGSSLTNSSDAYKIYGYQQPAITNVNFAAFAKPALEKDIHDNLAGFTIGAETTGQFAGSPAYIINATNAAKGVAYVEAAVLHPGAKTDNIFIFVHAITATTTDLNKIEAGWQWK